MREKRERSARLAAAAALVAVMLAVCVRAPAVHSTDSHETQIMYDVEHISPKFARNLDLIIFSQGFIRVETREALDRLSVWLNKNKYKRLPEFLDTLTPDNTKILFTAFLNGHEVGSTECSPVAEAPEVTGQDTSLCFPFKGEFYVIQGNGGTISHQKGTRNGFAWDFLIMKNKTMFKTASHKNSNYFAWGQPVYAPAPGHVVEVRSDMPDHPPLSTKMLGANYVIIEHENHEESVIYHFMNGSVKVKVGDDVEQGTVIANVGDSGMSMFPHIHYELDRRDHDKNIPGPSRFSSYYMRREGDPDWRLVISGVPQVGDFVLGVNDYLDIFNGSE